MHIPIFSAGTKRKWGLNKNELAIKIEIIKMTDKAIKQTRFISGRRR
jgi:hypothetical protein